MSASALLMEHGQEQREEVFREESGALGGGVDSVGLYGSGHGVDVFIKHGQKRNVIARGDLVVHEVELMDVGGAVVGRERDAGEQDPGMGGEQAGDDVFEIAFCDRQRQAAEAVVAAEFDDDDGGVHGEDAGQAVDTVLAGVAADAGIDDAVMVAAGVEVVLERGGPGLAGFESVAGGDAVSVADDDGLFLFGGMRGKWNKGDNEGKQQREGNAAKFHV